MPDPITSFQSTVTVGQNYGVVSSLSHLRNQKYDLEYPKVVSFVERYFHDLFPTDPILLADSLQINVGW